MVRLFVSDIDGCISEPFVPFDLDNICAIRKLAESGSVSSVPDTPPGFTLCTGRPLGYAEAVAQALGVTEPFLFEAGAGMFFPNTGVRKWHPDFSPETARSIADIQEWLEGIARGTTLSVDRGKHTQAGVIGADPQEVGTAIEQTTAFVEENHPGFVVAFTPVSVDVMLGHLTKAEGLEWLGLETGVPLAEMAFIGDTNGDLGALRTVGHPFAPANGTEAVRQAAGTVTRGEVSAGVLEALQLCIDRNRTASR